MILTGRYALQSLSYSKHHRRIETTAKHSDVAKLVYHASMTELVLPRLQTCQRILMEMEEKKNINTTKDMFKMALAVEYMKAVVSNASWIPAVCEVHNVVDRLHIQSKTVVGQRGVKPLSAVEAVQNLLREFQRPYCMGSLRRRNILASCPGTHRSQIQTPNNPRRMHGRRMRMKSRNNRTQRSLGPSRALAQPVCQSFIRIK